MSEAARRISVVGVAILVGTAMALGGCTRSPPAPVEYKGAQRSAPLAPVPKSRPAAVAQARPAEARLADAGTSPSIKPRRREDARVVAVEVAPVAAARPIRERAPDAGERRADDEAAGGAVAVRRGDTIHAIARRHNVSMRALIAVNRLKAPYTLAVGQRLELPPAATYTVRAGDTIYAISRRFGVDMPTLVRTNGVSAPYVVKVGQRLHIPATDVAAASTGAAVGDPTAPPPPRAGTTFVWPVKGRVLSGFGPKAGGLHNDGINIAAESGTIVRAADNGIVAYAGNELRGFGQLLLIRHADGWITAYAHNAELLVARGQEVKRGQAISRVGATGAVRQPQLHFEVRKGIRAIDPLLYLSKASAAASVESNA